MNVGIIGPGKVGIAMGIALDKKNINISGVYSRNEESFNKICRTIDKTFNNDIYKVINDSDVILICVSDKSITAISDIISKVTVPIDNKIFLHMSGALTSDALNSVRKRNALVGSLHPIQTFSGHDTDYKKTQGIYFGFEGDHGCDKFVSKLVSELGGKIITIKKEEKTSYHAAACIISNFAVTLSYITSKVLDSIDLELTPFLPLLENTADNIKEKGVIRSLTGPISRGEVNTVSLHLDALKKHEKILDVYKKLGIITVDLVKEWDDDKYAQNSEDMAKIMKLFEK